MKILNFSWRHAILIITLSIGTFSCVTSNDSLSTHNPNTAEISAIPKDNTDSSYGPWELGMTREDVMSISKYGPYKLITSTGGLETKEGFFEGEKHSVSFYFSPEGKLNKIMVLVYEGKNAEAAVNAWTIAYKYLTKNYGPVKIPGIEIQGGNLPDVVLGMIFKSFILGIESADKETIIQFSENKKFEMWPQNMPLNKKVWASLINDKQYGYFVFIFHASR